MEEDGRLRAGGGGEREVACCKLGRDHRQVQVERLRGPRRKIGTDAGVQGVVHSAWEHGARSVERGKKSACTGGWLMCLGTGSVPSMENHLIIGGYMSTRAGIQHREAHQGPH